MNKPNSTGWEEIEISIVLSILVTIAIILRFVAKARRGLRLEPDDWLALVCLVFIYGLFIDGVIWATIGANGKHLKNLTPSQIDMYFEIFLTNRILFALTSPLIKISILLFYRRLFTTSRFRLISNILIGACMVWSLIAVFSAIFVCRKDCKWGWQLGGAIPPYLWCTQIINVGLDFATLCLPFWMIWLGGLKLRLGEKAALSGVFLLGGFVVFASIIRLVSFTYVSGSDVTYSVYKSTIWTFTEPCLGLFCACLPTIRSLFPSSYKARNKSPSPVQMS